MTKQVEACLEAHADADIRLSVADIADKLGLHLDSVASVCSKLHKAHKIRAESIWVPGNRPYCSHPVLHYFMSKKHE